MSSTSGAVWKGKSEDETFLVHYNIVDYDFIEMFKIEMINGRSFSEEFSIISLYFADNYTYFRRFCANITER